MKNVILISLLLVLFACNQTSKTPPPCRELSYDCEIQKKFMALKILEIPKNFDCVDAFGDPLLVGKWYLRSNATQILFPLDYKNPNESNEVGVDELEKMSFPLNRDSQKTIKDKVQIHAGNTGSPLGILIKAEVLVSKNGELNLYLMDKIVHPHLETYN